jgi:hypothetical protein
MRQQRTEAVAIGRPACVISVSKQTLRLPRRLLSAFRRRKTVGAFAVFASRLLPFAPSSSYVIKRPCQAHFTKFPRVVAAPALLDREAGRRSTTEQFNVMAADRESEVIEFHRAWIKGGRTAVRLPQAVSARATVSGRGRFWPAPGQAQA